MRDIRKIFSFTYGLGEGQKVIPLPPVSTTTPDTLRNEIDKTRSLLFKDLGEKTPSQPTETKSTENPSK
jgi:hypothetical protein